MKAPTISNSQHIWQQILTITANYESLASHHIWWNTLKQSCLGVKQRCTPHFPHTTRDVPLHPCLRQRPCFKHHLGTWYSPSTRRSSCGNGAQTFLRFGSGWLSSVVGRPLLRPRHLTDFTALLQREFAILAVNSLSFIGLSTRSSFLYISHLLTTIISIKW